MAENGIRCCKWALIILSLIFQTVGAALVTFSGWLETNASEKLLQIIAGILIFQGLIMVALGGAGLYYSQKKEGFNVKKICVPLLILALVNIVTGVFFYFKVAELKEELLQLYKESEENKEKRFLFAGYVMNLRSICFVAGLIKGQYDKNMLDMCGDVGKPACIDNLTSCFNILGFGGLGIFLATAAILVITVLCIAAVVKRTAQNNRDYSLAMS